jgi:hypothetical protein
MANGITPAHPTADWTRLTYLQFRPIGSGLKNGGKTLLGRMSNVAKHTGKTEISAEKPR